MFRLVEVVLEPGKRAAYPLQRQPVRRVHGLCAQPAYAGVEIPRELHHSRGRELDTREVSSNTSMAGTVIFSQYYKSMAVDRFHYSHS